MFYIDVPSNVVAPAREVLLGVSRRSAFAPRVWRDSFRTRGSGRDNPRDVITGTVDYNIDLQSNAILKMIISALEAAGIHSCAGRQQIFQNKNAMIFEFNKTTQFLAMRPFLGESILLSPGKCLCLPSVDGSVLTRALTESEELHSAKFRFRRSGPMSGQIFAGAKAVREHVNALKTAAFILRQPELDRQLHEYQVIVQVLYYEHINTPSIAGIIINKIAETFAGPISLSESLDQDPALVAHQWRRLLQGAQ